MVGLILAVGMGALCWHYQPSGHVARWVLAGFVMLWMFGRCPPLAPLWLALMVLSTVWKTSRWALGCGLLLLFLYPQIYHLPGLNVEWVDTKPFRQGALLLGLSFYYLWLSREQTEVVQMPVSQKALYLLPWQSWWLSIVHGPKEWAAQSGRPTWETALWALQSGLLLWVKSRLYFGLHTYAGVWVHDYEFALGLSTASPATVWIYAGVKYLEWYLLLSMLGDAVNLVLRLSGYRLRSTFHFPLLAWSPIEIWRRWALWNRLFLLRAIYFPMGGNGRLVLINVFAVFFGSVVLLHTGVVGELSWQFNREYTISWFWYLMAQGVLVCGELIYWKWRRQERPRQFSLRKPSRWLGWGLTHAATLALHIPVLLPWGMGLEERFAVFARLFGW